MAESGDARRAYEAWAKFWGWFERRMREKHEARWGTRKRGDRGRRLGRIGANVRA